MNNDLNELYKEILDYNKKDYETLLNYYVNLLKKINYVFWSYELNDINEHFKEEKDINIRSLWYYIQKKHGDNIEKPLVFSFNDDLKKIENDLSLKAHEIEEKYIDYYNSSSFIKVLKNIIVELLKDNKTGLSFDEILKHINLDCISKTNDVERAVNSLVKDNKVLIMDNRNPHVYYLNSNV